MNGRLRRKGPSLNHVHDVKVIPGIKINLIKMENKDGLCEAEVRKNLVLADIGEPLTLPLSILNKNCSFKKEWNRIQKVWHGKKVLCKNCGKEFMISKGKRKYCSPECRNDYAKAYYKSYNQRPEVRAKAKAFNERPDVKARAKAYHKRPDVIARAKAYYAKPEVKARMKAYNQIPEVKAKRRVRAKAYYAKPEVKAWKKVYSQKPEVKAKAKAYYKKNRKRILQKHKEKYIDKKLSM